MDLGITPVDPRVREVFAQAIDQLEQAGVRTNEAHPDFSGLNDAFHVLRAASYASSYRALLEEYGEEIDDSPEALYRRIPRNAWLLHSANT